MNPFIRSPQLLFVSLGAVSAMGRGVSDRAGLRFDMFRANLGERHAGWTRVLNRVLGARPKTVRLREGGGLEFTYRAGTSDLLVLEQVFVSREYDVAELPASGIETVLDLGSNIGATAMRWLTKWPRCRVMCVEPDDESFAILEVNTRGFGDRARCVKAAVSDRDGEAVFYRSRAGRAWSNSLDRRLVHGESEEVRVPTVSMRTLFERSGFRSVDLVKMDIEGAEGALLAGIEQWGFIPRYLVVELHAPHEFDLFRCACERIGLAALPAGEGNPERKLPWGVPRSTVRGPRDMVTEAAAS